MAETEKTSWFVAQLRPHGLAQARKNLQRQGFEVFSPEILGSQRRHGKLHPMRKPLFSGYIFVSFDPTLSGWTAINNTPGISRLILHDPRRPRPLPEGLIAGLRERCDASELVMAATELDVGDRIRVLSGPFADLVTTIDTLPDSDRVSVLIELMGREVRTSLPRFQISKVS